MLYFLQGCEINHSFIRQSSLPDTKFKDGEIRQDLQEKQDKKIKIPRILLILSIFVLWFS